VLEHDHCAAAEAVDQLQVDTDLQARDVQVQEAVTSTLFREVFDSHNGLGLLMQQPSCLFSSIVLEADG